MRFGVSVLVSLVCASLSFGQTTYTWTNVGTDWGTASNWSPAVVPNDLINSIAAFGAQAAPMQPNLAGVFAVRGITFDNSLSLWNLSGSAGNQLATGVNGIIWTGGGGSLISANMLIAASQTWDVGTSTVTIGGAGGSINGSTTLTKFGTGILILDSGTGLFTGGYNITAGVLQAGSATNNSANQALRSNAVTLAGGTSLTTLGGTAALAVGSLNGSGSVTPAAGGAITQTVLADATFSGAITTTGGLNVRGNNGTTQVFNGNLTALTGTVAPGSGATMVLSGTGDSTSGVLGSTGASAINTRGGTLTLDNSGGNTGAAAGRLTDGAAISFGGGGISLIGNSAGTTETVGGFTLNSGSSTVSVTNNGGSGAVLAFTDSGSLRDSTSGTINFVGQGTGTLGSAGNAPRITFSGAINANTVNGALTSTASGPTSVTYGWARVNSTSWAGNGANGIVALAEVARDSSTLGSVAANEISTFTPSTTTTTLGGNLGVAATPLLFKITPSAASQSLASGGFNINASAIMLAGNTDFSITGAGSFFGTVASTRYVYVTDGNTVLSVSQSFAGAQQPFGKSGPGTVFLNGGSNQLNFTSVQNINILEGALRGTLTSLGGGTSAGGAFTTLNLYGGVIEISGGGTFSRALNVAGAAGGGGLKWDGGVGVRGDGGFSAIGGNAVVTLVTAVGGATPAAPVWNTGGFVADGQALVMGSVKADSTIEFTNNIGLDSGAATNPYNAREIRVAKNVGSATDIARLSGTISGSANADLLKTGAGTLELTGANTYSGNTIIKEGLLRVNNSTGSGTGMGKVTVGSSGRIGGGGTIVPAAGLDVAIDGVVEPGSSVGTLTFGSSPVPTSVKAHGHYAFELSNAGNSAPVDTGGSSASASHDLLTVFGSLDVTGLVIDPTSLGTPNFDQHLSYSWTVATATAGVTGIPGTVTIGTGTEFAGMTFFTSIAGNNVYLNFTPVPEPATVLGIAAAGLGIGGLIRRRLRKNSVA